jgi:hypothetical protein
MRFSIPAIVAIYLLSGNSFAKWELYDLQGKEITSLATGRYFGDTMILAGTKSEGVFVQYKRTGAFSLLTRAGADTVVPAIHSIHSLFMQASPGVPALYAGSDSGLFSYRFTSGLLPQWYKSNGIPSEPVLAITGRNDTLFAATRSEIYKSGTGLATWEPCSARTFLPVGQRLSTFSSLSIFAGINAGSTMSAAFSSWWGVLNSSSWGKSWTDISTFPGQLEPRITSVFSFATYAPDWTKPQRLVAGTGTGIFWVDNFDTGSWHAVDPQLKTAPARHLFVSYHSKSTIADMFASTDSGVCILSALVKNGEWVLSYQGKANAVISLTAMDPKEWFAATSDGVYRFTLDNAGVFPGNVSSQIKKYHAGGRSMVCSIDGRIIGAYDKSMGLPHGIYLVKQGPGLRIIVR